MTEVQTREQIDRWIEHAVAPLRERIEALEANFRTTRRPKARPSAASLHIRPPSPSSAAIVRPSREELAETIHNARWPADRQLMITPFADEDTSGRTYCFRLADAVLAANFTSVAQPSRDAVIEECAAICDKHAAWAEEKIERNPSSNASQHFANALEAYATPLPSSAGRASAAEVEVHVHDLIAEALGQEGITYSGVRRAARDIIKAFNINGVAQASPQHDHRVYFGCECCEEHAPENGVNCREDIGVMPDGTWLCDGCYSDCDKSTYGMVASDIDDFEFPRFEDLPRPAPYGASPIPSTNCGGGK